MEPQAPLRPSERARVLRLLAVVAAVALVVRLVCLPSILHALPLYTETRKGFDMHGYNVWAQQVAAGDWLSRQQGPFFGAPLYPYLLAGVYLLAGPGNVAAGVALNGLLGVAAAVCAAGLGRRLFGWWGGLAAGLLMALNGQQISTEAMLLGDSVLTALSLGALWLLMEVRHRDEGAERVRLGAWLLPGLVLGVAALGRGTFMAVGAALAAAVFAKLRGRGRRRAVGAAALLALGVCLPVLPVVVRNGAMFGQWTVQTNGPITLYLGNVPGAPGVFEYPKGFNPQQHPLGDGAYWVRQLGHELAGRPASLIPTTLRKAALFLNSWDAPDNGSYDFVRRYVPAVRALTVGPLPVYVIGFLGLFLTLGRRRAMAPLYVFGAAFALCVIAGVVNGRYKLPFLGLLCVFGGGAAVVLGGLVRQRRAKELAVCAGLAGALAVAFWPRGPLGEPQVPCPLRPNDFANNASALIQRDRRPEARVMLQDAITLFPRQAWFAEAQAQLSLDAGRPQEALDVVHAALDRGVATRRLLEQRVVALHALDRPAEARRAAEELLRLFPESSIGRRAMELTGG